MPVPLNCTWSCRPPGNLQGNRRCGNWMRKWMSASIVARTRP